MADLAPLAMDHYGLSDDNDLTATETRFDGVQYKGDDYGLKQAGTAHKEAASEQYGTGWAPEVPKAEITDGDQHSAEWAPEPTQETIATKETEENLYNMYASSNHDDHEAEEFSTYSEQAVSGEMIDTNALNRETPQQSERTGLEDSGSEHIEFNEQTKPKSFDRGRDFDARSSKDLTAHRHYIPFHPVCNKLLAKQWDRADRRLQLDKLAKARLTVDNAPPRIHMHLQLKLKRLQVEEGSFHGTAGELVLCFEAGSNEESEFLESNRKPDTSSDDLQNQADELFIVAPEGMLAQHNYLDNDHVLYSPCLDTSINTAAEKELRIIWQVVVNLNKTVNEYEDQRDAEVEHHLNNQAFELSLSEGQCDDGPNNMMPIEGNAMRLVVFTQVGELFTGIVDFGIYVIKGVPSFEAPYSLLTGGIVAQATLIPN
ncbi:hypothetical protein BJ742DRAFT_775961 [Cladochytrium replicatum]|nr:hypothetical protein BJ742DRAFT_775961 [Cladochytrium replicatum]